jgi:hypothetical protein
LRSRITTTAIVTARVARSSSANIGRCEAIRCQSVWVRVTQVRPFRRRLRLIAGCAGRAN